TDSMSSPIVKYSAHQLIAKSEMAYFVDSFVAPFSLANALIVSLGLKKRNEVYKNFEYLENIWEEYQVYEKM
ncbi:MAG: N-acetylmannosamine kinase, partial [Clostridia bacterium]|nr:N-acetylmannosamine kinase [Clostridia bacterium]